MHPEIRIDPFAGASADLSREHFAAIVESSDDAILAKDRDGIITSWNPAAQRMYGYTPEEAIGQPISILIPEHRSGEEYRILKRILSGERVDHYETERVAKDGRQLVVSLSVAPIRDAEGEITGAAVIARDITASHRTRDLSARIHDVTAALSRELVPERVIDVVLEQATAGLGASAGAVGLVEGDEVALAGHVGYSEEGLAGWSRFPLEADVPMSVAIRSGAGVYAADGEELVERFPVFADSTIRHPALAVLPLISGDEAFGAISLSFERAHEFDSEERAFLLSATQQAAYALMRASRYEAERLDAQRQRFLAEAGEVLTSSLDPDTTLLRLAEIAIEHVADWCDIELREADGELHKRRGRPRRSGPRPARARAA